MGNNTGHIYGTPGSYHGLYILHLWDSDFFWIPLSKMVFIYRKQPNFLNM